MQNSRILVVIAAALGLGAGAYSAVQLVASDTDQAPVTATYLPSGKAIDDFTLVGPSGQPFTQADLEGRWSMLFFGFTSCPDVCPMTMTLMDGAYERIAESGVEPPQVVFVSVDPARDTPTKLEDYVEYFNPAFVGVTGEREQLDRLTRGIGIAYAVHEDPDGDGQYGVDHSGAVVVVDPEGNFRALFGAPRTPDEVAEDFLRIRELAG